MMRGIPGHPGYFATRDGEIFSTKQIRGRGIHRLALGNGKADRETGPQNLH